MPETMNTVIVGGGQAGLALKQGVTSSHRDDFGNVHR